MDAQMIYKMMKPQLDLLDVSERKNLIKLIKAVPAKKVSSHHRKVLSLTKAKERLRNMCRREMKREQLEQQGS
jgi:D-aminopeptidase